MNSTENLNLNRGGCTAYSIGNGQLHDALSISKEVSKTLNCMDDPAKVLIVWNEENELEVLERK